MISGLFNWLAFLFVLVLLRALPRKEWVAVAAFVLLIGIWIGGGQNQDAAALVTSLIWLVLAVLLLIRFGLLASLANRVIYTLLNSFPLTTQGSAWYAGISLTAILLMAAIAFYGFYTSLGARPVFGSAALAE